MLLKTFLRLCEDKNNPQLFFRCCNESINHVMKNQRLKHIVLELYERAKQNFIVGLREAISDSYILILHLNLDICTSKVSKDKSVGVQIFFIDRDWELRSHILGLECSIQLLKNIGSQERLTPLLNGLVRK